METFETLNAEIWAISPDEIERLEKMRTEESLVIPLLLDPELEITKQLGLVNDKGNLPHPTAIVIESDGTVSYLRVDEDVTKRPSNKELIEALEASKSAS